jgi:endonuclease YncB( thermonuclease family)
MLNIFVLFAFIAGAWAAPAYAIEKCGSGKRINCIVDGDTFWQNGEKIRAMGYDTPEPTTNICGGEREKRLAAKATARLLQLFNSTEITIERHGTDHYGRTLAVVRSNGRAIGDILISEELARKYPDGPEFWCD